MEYLLNLGLVEKTGIYHYPYRIVASKEKLHDVENMFILLGQTGGMPEMVFEFILKKNDIDPKADLSIDQSIDFGATAAAFSGGQGDFTVEFEPGASTLEKEGGRICSSLPWHRLRLRALHRLQCKAELSQGTPGAGSGLYQRSAKRYGLRAEPHAGGDC